MNLITDLGAEIAFAVLVENRHNETIKATEILTLIGRLNEALDQMVERDDSNVLFLRETELVKSAVR